MTRNLIISQRYKNKETGKTETLVDVQGNKVITKEHPYGIEEERFFRKYFLTPLANLKGIKV